MSESTTTILITAVLYVIIGYLEVRGRIAYRKSLPQPKPKRGRGEQIDDNVYLFEVLSWPMALFSVIITVLCDYVISPALLLLKKMVDYMFGLIFKPYVPHPYEKHLPSHIESVSEFTFENFAERKAVLQGYIERSTAVHGGYHAELQALLQLGMERKWLTPVDPDAAFPPAER